MDTKQNRPTLANMEDLHDFLVSELRMANKPLNFFVGAGISIPSPSCLPSSNSIISLVLDALCINLKTTTYLDNLPKRAIDVKIKMEVLFDIIKRNASPRFNLLFSLFEKGKPNLYHYFFARLLDANLIKYIITTNFDTFIEKSANGELNVLATDSEHSKRLDRSLFKIHGTIDRFETIVAMLPQVSRGLGFHKKKLLNETLNKTCIVIGWSDNDIDLTPLFYEAERGSLIWFYYAPKMQKVVDFMETPEWGGVPDIDLENIKLILKKTCGVLVLCDPMPFFLNIWHTLREELGSIPNIESKSKIDFFSIVRTWAELFTTEERLMIIGDIFRHLSSWNEAISLYKKAETHQSILDELYYIHYRLGLCSTHLSNWQDAFKYFNLALKDKGYQPSIEILLDDCPEDPSLAPLYGNIGLLFKKIGRYQDAAKCFEMDLALCERYQLEGESQAYTNYADILRFLGNIEEAKNIAEKGINKGVKEGNILAIRDGRSSLAELAACRGDWAEAEIQLKRTLEIDEMISRSDLQISTLNNLATYACTIGEFDPAIKYTRMALEIAESHNLYDLQTSVLITQGIIHKKKIAHNQISTYQSKSSQFQTIFDIYSKALSLIKDHSLSERLKSIVLTNRGLLYYLQEDYQNALRDLWESLEIRTKLLDDLGRAHILDNLALVFLKGEMVDEAEGYLQEALNIYDRFKHKPGQCQIFNDLGAVYATRLYIFGQRSGEHRDALKNYYQKAEGYYIKSLTLARKLQIPGKISQAEQNLVILKQLY